MADSSRLRSCIQHLLVTLYSNEIARVTVERELLAAGPPTKSLPLYLTYLTKIHH
jgi:hypothetical protein